MTKNDQVERITVYRLCSARFIYYSVKQMISGIGILLVISKKQRCKAGRVSFKVFKRLVVAMGSNICIKHANFLTKSMTMIVKIFGIISLSSSSVSYNAPSSYS